MHYSVRKGISIEHSGSRSWKNNCFVFTPRDVRFSVISVILVFPLLVILILIPLHLARELPWGNIYLGTTINSYPSINWRHKTEWTFFPPWNSEYTPPLSCKIQKAKTINVNVVLSPLGQYLLFQSTIF